MFEQIAEKMKVLKVVVSSIEKQFGKGAIMALGDSVETEPVATIRTGSIALDIATGSAGYPRGRVVEVYGPESSGKTTLALHAIAEAQRVGGVCAFIDAEHALDLAYARNVGVETEKLFVSQPDTGEQAIDIAESLVRSGAVDLIVIESGGDNLAASFSPELADLMIYVIDVSAGDKIPRKGGPGITKSDLLVINKIDLAHHVGADLAVMESDARRMRGERPFLFSNLKNGAGVDAIVDWLKRQLRLSP